jgi:hypothetical protein
MNARHEPVDLTARDEELLATVEAVLAGDGAPSHAPGSLAALCADLRAAAPQADPAFRRRLEERIVAHAAARARPAGRPGRGAGGAWVRATAAAAVVLVAVAGAAWSVPAVRAEVARLACFVPGLGIRACGASALVMAGPVSVERDGLTLSVNQLLSAGGETVVQVEVRGLPPPAAEPRPAPLRPRFELRDERGRVYAQATRSGGFVTRRQDPPGGTRWVFQAEPSFGPLDPDVRAVELLLEAADPVGSWRVAVPLVPAPSAGLATAQPVTASATLHGLTVSVAGVVADGERTAFALRAEAGPGQQVRALATEGRGLRGVQLGPELDPTLRDDRGQLYYERLSPWQPITGAADPSGAYAEDVLFPPLPADARWAELTVPFVVVEEEVPDAALTVPIAAGQPGTPVPTELTRGPYTVRIRGTRVEEQDPLERERVRRVVLALDPGDWQGGRKLLSPGQALVDGMTAPRTRWRTGGDWPSQVTELAVPLPEHADRITVRFRNIAVAVQGPWRLRVPLRRGP